MIDEHQRLKDGITRVLKAHVGQENAITTHALADWLHKHGHSSAVPTVKGHVGKYDTRALRDCIQDLRRDGHIICSRSGTGLYLPATRQEAEDYIVNEMEDRAKSILKTASIQRAAMERAFPAQEQLGLFQEAR